MHILSIITIVILLSLLVGTLIALDKSLTREKKLKSSLDELQDKIEDAYLKMREIDDRQIFERDDDVGVVFEQIYTIIKEINDDEQSN